MVEFILCFVYSLFVHGNVLDERGAAKEEEDAGEAELEEAPGRDDGAAERELRAAQQHPASVVTPPLDTGSVMTAMFSFR